MFSIIGIVLVFAAIVGGYLMEKGNLLVLLQPAELIIIAGAAAGTVLIANPLYILKQIVQGFVGVFKGSRFTRQLYLDSLKMLFDLFNRSRREGLTAIEAAAGVRSGHWMPPVVACFEDVGRSGPHRAGVQPQ